MEEPLFRVISNLRKTGNLKEAWDKGCPAVQESPNDSYLKGAFFWVCYEYLKQVQVQVKDRAKQNNGNQTPNQGELDRFDFFLDWIIWLNIPPGGYEYRSLLLLFQNNLEYVPKLVLLLAKFGISLLNDEDKIPFQNDHGESPSLALKFVRKVAKAWMEIEEVRQISIDQLILLMTQVREIAQDKQHKIWLDYDEAKCLLMAGRNDEARDFVIRVLKKKQSESWAWGALAATYRTTDPNAAIKLFALGISHSHDEKFALKLLKGIAPLLADNGLTSEASMCVQRAVKCYQDNGWRVKADLEKLMNQPWFDDSVDMLLLKPFITEIKQGAEEYLHGPTKECFGVVINLHKSGKGCHVYINENESIAVPLCLFEGKKPSLGDYIKMAYSGDDKDANKSFIRANLTEFREMSGIGSIIDELRITDKGFGFVGDTFVPPFLISADMGNKVVEVLRYKDSDKKNWSALKIRVVE